MQLEPAPRESRSTLQLGDVPTRRDGLYGPTFDVRAHVRDVVVVVSSSRSGSSMLAELLRREPDLLHFRGELTPLLALAGLTRESGTTDSDALDDAPYPGVGLLAHEMSAEIGNPLNHVVDAEAFARQVAWRLKSAWPDHGFDVSEALGWARAAARRAARGQPEFDATGFHLDVLARARASGASLCPYLYDIRHERIPASFERPMPGAALPFERLLEEPPFVAIVPWQLARPADLRARTLVVKCPSNAYRLPFLRRLFPAARFRVLHLTRNPAASINGLWDGWRFRGFHSHRLPAPLEIPGYTDSRPQDRWWWKFDMPPDWRRHANRPLLEVCAAQWSGAHRAVLEWLASAEVDSLRVRFEDLIGEPAVVRRTIARMFGWLGLPPRRAEVASSARLPPVMATVAPRRGRWRERERALEPVLALSSVRAVAERLDYDDRNEWI